MSREATRGGGASATRPHVGSGALGRRPVPGRVLQPPTARRRPEGVSPAPLDPPAPCPIGKAGGRGSETCSWPPAPDAPGSAGSSSKCATRPRARAPRPRRPPVRSRRARRHPRRPRRVAVGDRVADQHRPLRRAAGPRDRLEQVPRVGLAHRQACRRRAAPRNAAQPELLDQEQRQPLRLVGADPRAASRPPPAVQRRLRPVVEPGVHRERRAVALEEPRKEPVDLRLVAAPTRPSPARSIARPPAKAIARSPAGSSRGAVPRLGERPRSPPRSDRRRCRPGSRRDRRPPPACSASARASRTVCRKPQESETKSDPPGLSPPPRLLEPAHDARGAPPHAHRRHRPRRRQGHPDEVRPAEGAAPARRRAAGRPCARRRPRR